MSADALAALKGLPRAAAVVLSAPGKVSLDRLELIPPGDDDVVVDVEFSGISTGTERLLWSGRMPDFPGMGYPLVPGYESVGRICGAGRRSGRRVGETVFVPGAKCYVSARGLFGGASQRVVVPAARAVPIEPSLGENGVLVALAATAQHALAGSNLPELIVGHGVLGRLLARITVAHGGRPIVWERNPARVAGAAGYEVIDPGADSRRDYRTICDASGDPDLLDDLVLRLAHGGEIVLAGFYERPLSLAFPAAFMREARFRVAAEWRQADLAEILRLLSAGHLTLDGLITHRRSASAAGDAYRVAFEDVACLKMILDWRVLE